MRGVDYVDTTIPRIIDACSDAGASVQHGAGFLPPGALTRAALFLNCSAARVIELGSLRPVLSQPAAYSDLEMALSPMSTR
jgi:hypothetical protein